MNNNAQAGGSYPDLLSSIMGVTIRNEEKISAEDHNFCVDQQEKLHETLRQLKWWYDMFVANARRLISKIERGDTKAEVVAAMKFGMGHPEKWAGEVEELIDFMSLKLLIPMWGQLTNQIPTGDYFEDAHDINLVRMMARVNVVLGPGVDENFSLALAYFYNFSIFGSVIPDLSYDWDDPSFSMADYTSPSLPGPWSEIVANTANTNMEYSYITGQSWGDNAVDNEIYIFEAPAGVPVSAGSTAYKTNPCIVVGGNYGDGAGTTYYRIDLTQRDEVTGELVYLPILRNNSYTITINSVSGPGHKYQWEAFESIPTNIDASIINWRDTGIGTGITDGRYRLGVTKEVYELIPDQHADAGSDNVLNISTDHPGGWTATVYTDENCTTPAGGGFWLTLSDSSGEENYADGGESIHYRTTALPPDQQSRTAWVKVQAGGMSFVISVTQVQMFVEITAVGGINDGQVIERISFTSKNSDLSSGGIAATRTTRAIPPSAGVPPTAQKFKVSWGPVSTPLRIVSFPGLDATAQMQWQQDPDNPITYLTADNAPGGEYTFTVAPAPFRAETIAEYPFYKEATTVMFELEGSEIMGQLAIDMTHYNFLASGINSRVGNISGTVETATIHSNAPWQMTLSDPANILDLNPAVEVQLEAGNPFRSPANTLGSSHVYNFNGNAGKATFLFSPQPDGPQFDPVSMTISETNITSQFARSNIVMVKDPATGKKILTFAETEEDWGDNESGGKYIKLIDQRKVIPADAIGLLFRWGSLVGLSPYSVSFSSEGSMGFDRKSDMSVNTDESIVVYWPEELEAAGNLPTGSEWGLRGYTPKAERKATDQIPYIGWDDYPELYANSSEDFKTMDVVLPSPTLGYNAAEGIGDICRYISAQDGWVEGKWRMPTYAEVRMLREETSSSFSAGSGVLAGNFRPDDPNSRLGVPRQGPDFYGFHRMSTGLFLGASASGIDDTGNPLGYATLFFPTTGYMSYGSHISGGVMQYEYAYFQEWYSNGHYISGTVMGNPSTGKVMAKGYYLLLPTTTVNEIPMTSSTTAPLTGTYPPRCIRDWDAPATP